MRLRLSFRPYPDPHARVLRKAVDELLACPRLSELHVRPGQMIVAVSAELGAVDAVATEALWRARVSFAAVGMDRGIETERVSEPMLALETEGPPDATDCPDDRPTEPSC